MNFTSSVHNSKIGKRNVWKLQNQEEIYEEKP